MEKKLAASQIDFADAEYISCEATPEKLVIYIKDWQEKMIKLVFSNPVQFLSRAGDVIRGVYEISGGLDNLYEALSHYNEKISENHPQRLFQVEDIYGVPFLQVLAESMHVIKEK